MRRAARALIDLSALRHNLDRARAGAPRARVLAVVKADGYGHGAVAAARALAGADALAVAHLGEALALREAAVRAPVLVLQGARDAPELAEAATQGLEIVVHHEAQLQALESTPAPIGVWLKVDSGMHRLGFAPRELPEIHARLGALQGVGAPPVLMTHLACAEDRADPSTARQLARFDQAVGGLPGARSIANSAGLLGYPDSHRDWVRPGIMLYGASPFVGGSGEREGLRPVMTLSAPLIAIRHLRAGDRVGYGGAYVCPEDMPVGVVAIGYADGYPRHAPSGTPVGVAGGRVALVGRVSMDMITVDLRGVRPPRLGDEVILWGPGLAVEEVAERSGTIAYELLCNAGRHCHREYV
jgi:alanine racemase